ncbi:MAG: hypothetical protein M3Z66_08040 [Chloroflexota bacterium]|nr:hypothetical protein [Chloroflexota bacterium]
MYDPPPATEASRVRLDLARRLIECCPPALGREIAMTGSAARGVADEYSDVELNLWAGAPPEADQYRAWLDRAGATDLTRDNWDADACHFRWTTCRFEDIWIEVGWAPIDQFDDFVRDLAGGAFGDHERLQMGWTVQQAIPLRTEGRLADWQAALVTYPTLLAERVVANQTTVWSDPHVPGVRWGLAARGERMGLSLRFVWDMQNLLRVLFAVNQQWDHDLKWTNERSLDLPIKPAELSARIDAMFTLTDLAQCVETNQRLIVETLELATGQGFMVSDALHSMREGLRIGLETTGRK